MYFMIPQLPNAYYPPSFLAYGIEVGYHRVISCDVSLNNLGAKFSKLNPNPIFEPNPIDW